MGGRGRGKKRARPMIRILTSGAVGELTNQAMLDSRLNEAAPADYPELPPERRAEPLPCAPADVYVAQVEEDVSLSVRFSGYHQSQYRAPEVERYGDRRRKVEGRRQVLDEKFKLETLYYPPELVHVRRAADRAAAVDRERRRVLLGDDALGLAGDLGLDLRQEEDLDDDDDDAAPRRIGAAARALARGAAGADDEFYAEDLNNDDVDDEDDGDYAAHGDMDDDDEGAENDAL